MSITWCDRAGSIACLWSCLSNDAQDGFFVAKFKVGKPAKTQAQFEEEPVEPFTAIAENEDDEPEVVEKTAFDDEEDRALIIEGKRAALKRKGIKVHPREKSKAKKIKT